jgi:hypothetical protein
MKLIFKILRTFYFLVFKTWELFITFRPWQLHANTQLTLLIISIHYFQSSIGSGYHTTTTSYGTYLFLIQFAILS